MENEHHDEACNGTVVEDPYGRGYYCSGGCGWTAAFEED
jgi:hypothetical protein